MTWRINGLPLLPQPDGRVRWPLQAGEWALEAATGSAQRRSKFRVEAP